MTRTPVDEDSLRPRIQYVSQGDYFTLLYQSLVQSPTASLRFQDHTPYRRRQSVGPDSHLYQLQPTASGESFFQILSRWMIPQLESLCGRRRS